MPNNKNQTFTVSAPCGTGKTTAITQHIATHQFENNWLYVTPTQRLMTSVAERFKSLGVDVKTISSETHKGTVLGSIYECLRHAPDEGMVVIITLEAYKSIAYFNRRENWQVVIDEIPQVDVCHQLTLPRNIEQISNRLQLARTINADISRVVAIDENALRQELAAVQDDVFDTFRELFIHALSDNYDTFVHTADWLRLVENKCFTIDERANQLSFVSMLKSRLFQDAILLGANVSDSLLYQWLKRYHKQTLYSHEIDAQLNTDIKPSNCTVAYFYSSRNFSKTLNQSTTDKSTDKTVIESMDEQAARLFGQDKFLFVANNGRVSTLDDLAKAERMPDSVGLCPLPYTYTGSCSRY